MDKASELLRQSGRRDWHLVVCLVLLTFLSRIPFRSHILYHWDSVNFANGMHAFDVLQEHPQPPGYIVYVWLCRLVNPVFQDANRTMVWMSVVASSLAVAILYLLGRDMWNRRVGLVAGLFLASSPLFWFYGEIALPHALDTLLVLLAVWLLYRVERGDERLLWPGIVVLGIAGGVRQQTLVFLLPLTLYIVGRGGGRRVILAGLLGAGVCLIWFVPLMTSCGGIGPYLEKTGTFATRFQSSTSVLMGAGWSGVTYNLRKLALYTAYGVGGAGVPLGIHWMIRLARQHWPRRWERLILLALWIVPALLFYGLIHMGQQGLVFIFLPAVLLLGGVSLEGLPLTRRAKAGVTALLVAMHVAAFCWVPEYPLGPGTQRVLTRDTVANSDRYYGDRFSAIRESFPPESTVILSANWDHARYYLPEYRVLSFAAAQGWVGDAGWMGASTSDEGGAIYQEGTAIVLFDPALVAYNDTPALAQGLPLEHSGMLEYLVLSREQIFHYGSRSFGIE